MEFVSGTKYTLNWLVEDDIFPVDYVLTPERKEIAGKKFAKFERVDTGKIQWLSHAKAVKMQKNQMPRFRGATELYYEHGNIIKRIFDEASYETKIKNIMYA